MESKLKEFYRVILWQIVGCCISSKHGFHSLAPVGPGSTWGNNWKPCLELVLRPGRVAGISLREKLVNVGFGTQVDGKYDNKSWR